MSPGSFQVTIDAIGNQLGHAAHACGHGRYAASHGFQSHQPKGLHFAGHEEHMRQRNDAFHVALLAEKGNMAFQAQFARQIFGRTSFRTIPHHHQVRRRTLQDLRQYAHTILHPLHRPEIRNMNQQLFSFGRIETRLRLLAIRHVQVAIHEVVDDAYLVTHAENVQRLLPEMVADGGYAVRLFDGKPRDRKIRSIHADQRDIRAMQCGDEWESPHRRQHLFREHGGDGMRNGVVHVQQIQIVRFGDFRHARGQRQAIRRIFEERISGDLHLVVADARNARIQADRIGVGDEVHLVAAICQFHAQLRSHDAASAVGGIAGNADVHFVRLARLV